MKKQGVIGLCVFDKPAHGVLDVFLRWPHSGFRLIIGQDDHIFALVVVIVYQEGGHIVNIVDASLQLGLAAKVIDSDE